MSNIRGRQPIGINQPPGGGSLYPFVNPSDDIKYLLGDFFISFDDLDDVVVYPLRIKWLYGFGTNVVTPIPGYSTATHAQDIIVVDAEDNVVFDSTTADSFKTSDWDSRLTIVEWESDSVVCRCTFHYEWTAADIADNNVVLYDNYIVPTSSELQVDTWYKLPKRVKSFIVGVQGVGKNHVVFKEGYNIGINSDTGFSTLAASLPTFASSKTLASGTRLRNSITLSAIPGTGLGTYPACSDTISEIKKINGVTGDGHQNFIFDTQECIRNQRPLGIVSTTPRVLSYGDFYLSNTEAKSAIKVSNDCTCCCACDHFARTYQGLKRQWFLYRDVAQAAETARDNYASNIDRWTVQKQIRESDNIRLRISMDGNCKVRYGIALCNSSKCCLSNVKVYITWLQFVNGVLQIPVRSAFNCPPTLIDGPAQCNGIDQGLPEYLDAHGQVLRFTVDYVDPQAVVTISGKHCFPDCHDVGVGALKTAVHVAITWDAAEVDPGSGNNCTYPVVAISNFPDDVQYIWTNAGISADLVYHSQKYSDILVLDKTNPYCYQCQCD